MQLGSSAAHAAQHAAAETASGEVDGKVRSVVAKLARKHTPTCREPQTEALCANCAKKVNSSRTAADATLPMDLYGIAASAWPPNQPVHSPRWYFATFTNTISPSSPT